MTELELKLELPPASASDLGTLKLLRGVENPGTTEKAVSVYFDTEKQQLHRKGILLRVRRIGDRHIQTIKSLRSSDLFERNQWESEIASETPDLHRARDSALRRYFSGKLRRKLKPIFETQVQRKTYHLCNNGGTIELALDKGRIGTEKDSQPLCEIELELKLGQKEALFALASQLVDALPAQLAIKSKAERGYELLNGNEVNVAKAEAPDLRPDLSVAEGLRAIGRSCLKQITGNLAALRADEAEGVHEMRVGLRRLRSAISLFSDILPDRQTAAVKREVKWLTGQLAPAREFDVLVRRVVAPVRQRPSHPPGIPTISQKLSDRRVQAMKRAKEAVGSPRFRRLALDIAAWLEIGEWAKPHDDLLRNRIEDPIDVFAASELSRRWRKLRRKVKSLREINAHQRHKLRIRGKRLRYACEFFSTLFPGKKVAKRRKSFLSKLKRMQDALGDLNDIAVHEDLIRANADLSVRAKPPRAGRKRAYAAGLLAGHEDARIDAVLSEATEAASVFRKATPFW